jgi:hypothetical protein
MNRATSLTIIAIGAIFAFAITTSPGFLNLQVVGWILMATGAAGLLLERRSRDWLRRTVIVRGSPDISRVNRRRRTQISAQPPAGHSSADGPTEPLDKPAERGPVERETIEEYVER